ncbi:MAG: metallophosphoesterase [Muribaculaceae bacterium]|nr:metallophosphoesterase [Muribaculaceae bacterium]
MRIPHLILLIFLIVDLLADGYIYAVICRRVRRAKLWNRAHLISAAVLLLALITAVVMPYRQGSDNQLLVVMWVLYAYATVYISKIFFVIIDLTAHLPNLWHHPHWKWVTRAGICGAILIFISMWWGALLNRFTMDVKPVEISISDLPESFDGYTIVQLSDLHLGSYNKNTTYVSRLVDEVNALEPDLIVFTGDIVNRRSAEMLPFTETLSKLKARDGVVSVLGNHDYGDYSSWKTEEAKRRNLELMIETQHKMGWDLLLNETRTISRGNDSIAVIGVENIGDPPFHSYGDLNKAYPTLDDSVTKILLSHNPAHWQTDIRGNNKVNIPLTLSGHTHAMQCTVGKISPARLRYKYWGGLYDDGGATDNRLYVNIGIGTVGFPARIGATPEITLITLRKK